jgi:hypothetical protein
VIFGKWSEMLICSWIGLDILVDPGERVNHSRAFAKQSISEGNWLGQRQVTLDRYSNRDGNFVLVVEVFRRLS